MKWTRPETAQVVIVIILQIVLAFEKKWRIITLREPVFREEYLLVAAGRVGVNVLYLCRSLYSLDNGCNSNQEVFGDGYSYR